MILGREDFDSDREYLVCCMARDIYANRKKRAMVPSGKYTWAKWFDKKFGLDYEAYIHELSNRARERSA